MTTPYPEQVFTNGVRDVVVNSRAEEVQLRWNGWYPKGSYTPPDPEPIAENLLPARLREEALRAAYVPADPVLSNFVYDNAGNLTSYQEDSITITLTYNADGTVATSQRGDAPAKTYSYSGGNLVEVA